MTVLKFPDRLGLKPPRDQWEALRHMKACELMAALVAKYPDVTFTSDELRAAQGRNIYVFMRGPGEWGMRVIAPNRTETP